MLKKDQPLTLNLKPIAACVAVAMLGGLPLMASAAPVTASSGGATLTKPGLVSASGTTFATVSNSSSIATSTGRFDVPLSQMLVSGGVTGAGGQSEGRAFLNYSFTNSTGFSLTTNFHYRINAGSIGFVGVTSSPGVSSSVRNQISTDGGTTWSDLGALLMNSSFGVATITSQSGDFAALNGFVANSTGASWGATEFDRSLGILAPGQTLSFSYGVFGSAAAGALSGFCCYQAGPRCAGTYNIGDPSAIALANNLMGLTFEAIKDGDVPLPATLLLAAAGMAGMGLGRRRRRS